VLIGVATLFLARKPGAGGGAPAAEAAHPPEAIARRCQAWPQAGCGDGQKCDMLCGATGPELGCLAAEGTLAKGQACDETVKSGPKSCVKGTVCLGFREGTRCAAFCDGDAACDGGKCVAAKVVLACPSGPSRPQPFVLHVCK
jgi:hypothetical protein